MSPCQTAYKASNKRQTKIRGLHEENGKKKAERRTFKVRPRSFGISRLHSSLLYSLIAATTASPMGGFDKRFYVHTVDLLPTTGPE